MKFEILRSGNQFRFLAKGNNGEIVATSETYTAKASAMSTIEMIKREAATATVTDLT